MALLGITRSGKDSLGGMLTCWIAEFSLSNFTVGADGLATFTPANFVEYQVRKQSSGVNTEATIDDPNGIIFHTSDITLKFPKMGDENLKAIEELLAKDLQVVVEDNNGQLFAYGVEMPVTSTGCTSGTGISFTDPNGFSITLSTVSRKALYKAKKAGASAQA